ncbi:MAG: serpin family protein [Chloroflexota bacterium]
MPRLRTLLALLLVATVVAGCGLIPLVVPASPGPGASPTPGVVPASPAVPASPGVVPPSPVVRPTPPASLPPRLTPAPRPSPTTLPGHPGPTPLPLPTPPPAAPTPTPRPPREPGPTAVPLAIKLLAPGDRAAARAPAADVAALVRGSTGFALDLLRRVTRAQDGANVVLGPSSITDAFALLGAGARGETATQIAATLGLELPPDRVAAAVNTLDQALADLQNRKLALSIVNQLFGQAGYPFQPAYLRTATRQFGAPLATLDFGRRPEAARKLINGWIADHTNDRITDILPPGAIDAATRLVIVNATWLKAEWDQPFQKAFTTTRPFIRQDGSTVKVPMMTQEGTFPAAFGPDWTAVELPYAGRKLAMLLVMPDHLDHFVQGLDADGLAAIVDALTTQHRVKGYPFSYVHLDMPRFSARTTVPLRPLLTRMGMRDVWDPATADLRGIADPAATGEAPLVASDATHQAWISVTEKGTEAAAVTTIDVGTGGGPPVAPPTITLDHPFLFFIRDTETGAILFAGRILDPSVGAD